MATGKWQDDAYLDDLRGRGDELADAAVAALVRTHGDQAVNRLFPKLRSNDDPLPDDAPEPLLTFLESTRSLPTGVDHARIERGSAAFLDYVLELGTLMLVRSLPAGYAAPRLSQVLCISNDLGSATFNRVLGVIQLLVNVGGRRGFEPDGHAVITAQKMRLLHAGSRHVATRYLPDFERDHGGVPVSVEDMLATLMGFSYYVLEPLLRMDLGLSQEEAEDIYYLWRVYGVMMGIHPPVPRGEAPGFDWVPGDLSEAAVFYESYSRRSYSSADRNPEGCYLAEADLHMLVQLLPRPLRWLGLGQIPKILMRDSLGPLAMARVGIEPPRFPALAESLWGLLLRLDRRTHRKSRHGLFLARALEDLIVWERGAPIGFEVPTSRAGLQHLAFKKTTPCLQSVAPASSPDWASRRRDASR